MIRLRIPTLDGVALAQFMLQQALTLELSTLPPYLYALYSIEPNAAHDETVGNAEAYDLILGIVRQEMIHLCLASNMLNAIGGTPVLSPPQYPGPLPGDVGGLVVNLLKFSVAAALQGAEIEKPSYLGAAAPNASGAKRFEPLMGSSGVDLYKAHRAAHQQRKLLHEVKGQAVTIGQYYEHIREVLRTLAPGTWRADRNQIVDNQFFPGQLFAVNSFADAEKAISEILSEGEGSEGDPLDFQGELAHFYRFLEIYFNKRITRTPHGYELGESLKIDFDKGVYDAIENPATYDFSGESKEAQDAQTACNKTYTQMIAALQRALNGTTAALGQAVASMFHLRTTAAHAYTVKLKNGKPAGPAFIYDPNLLQ